MSLLVSATVVMPSGKRAYPNIEDNKDGTVTVRYQPTETGLHQLHMQYNNEEIEGKSHDAGSTNHMERVSTLLDSSLQKLFLYYLLSTIGAFHQTTFFQKLVLSLSENN